MPQDFLYDSCYLKISVTVIDVTEETKEILLIQMFGTLNVLVVNLRWQFVMGCYQKILVTISLPCHFVHTLGR